MMNGRIKTFLEYFILGHVYIILYYISFRLPEKYFIYSSVHMIMASILLTVYSDSLRIQYLKKSYSIVTSMLWMIVIYFYVAAIKYPTCFFLVVNFNSNPIFRLEGSCIIAASTLIAIIINKNGTIILGNDDIFQVKDYVLLIFICVMFYTNILHPQMIHSAGYFNEDSVFMQIFKEGLNALFIIIAFYNTINANVKISIKLSGGKRLPVGRKHIYLFIILFIYLVGAIITGRRTTLIMPVALVLSMMQREYIIKPKTIIHITALIPIIYILISVLSFHVSKRLGEDASSYAAVLGYRLDLADFANEIASRTNIHTRNAKEILFDGMKSFFPTAIANHIGIDKTAVQRGYGGAYDELMSIAGLTTVDYGSNAFVMGATVAGYIGMVFMLPIITVVYRMVEHLFNRYFRHKSVFIGILSFYYLKIEMLWVSFFPRILWCVIICIFASIIMKIMYFAKAITYSE